MKHEKLDPIGDRNHTFINYHLKVSTTIIKPKNWS